MDGTLASLLSFYIFSSGRRLFAMQQVKSAASAVGFNALASHADVCIAHDRSTRDLEAKWAGQKAGTSYAPEARQLDIYVDAALTALRDGLDSQIKASAPGDPLGEAAQRLSQELFPKGAGAITSLPYVEELAELQRILGRAQHPDLTAVIGDLGLGRQVARLASLEKQYAAALVGPGGQVAFAQVKDARAKGQSLMLQAVAMTLGQYPSDSEADRKARNGLLAPIFAQNEAIRSYLRQRMAIEDVNPDTGAIEPAPAPQPSPT
jgi:hypothetical protein